MQTIKLDLTREVNALGMRINPQTGKGDGAVQFTTPLSKYVTDNLMRVHSIKKALDVRDLLDKIKTNAQFNATDEELKVILGIFRNVETENIYVFSDMVKELNPNFDLVEFEAANFQDRQ